MDTISSSPSNCPLCGKPLPADTVSGCCPACLMAGAMQPTQPGDSANAIPPLTPEQLAPHFPQLEILECLGRGGMGVVYKARQKSLNRLVALKLLAPERVTDAQFAERFAREAQALAALNHPHIVTVHDFGVVEAVAPSPEGAPTGASGPPAKMFFFLMEFVDGVNLRQAMKAGRFTPEQALAIVPPVCEALQYAHEHGIVHRDIKPENLLLDKEGRVKIADFGIAKIIGCDADTPVREGVQTGVSASLTVGTPQYMAPEQKAHRATDHRADIYSLGVVLYELLTGELPADSLHPPSHKVQVDMRLDAIVLRALEKSPELRYQTAGEFRTRVETMAHPPTLPPGRTSSKRRWGRVLTPVIAVAVLAVLASAFFFSPLARRQKSSVPAPLPARTGPPFIAHVSGATAELLALTPYSSVRKPSWKPDGSPTEWPFSDTHDDGDAPGKVMREIAFHIRSSGRPLAGAKVRFDRASGIECPGSARTLTDEKKDMAFEQTIVCPPEMKSMNLQLGVLESDWQTMFSFQRPREGTNGGSMGSIQPSPDGEWEAYVRLREGKDGDVALAFNHSAKDGFESRIAYVKTDGTTVALKDDNNLAEMMHGMALMSAADFSHIGEFRFQTRRYEWVEFRNVSLQLGHRTAVEMVDTPGAGDTGNSVPASQTERALPPAAKLWEELDRAEKAMRHDDEQLREFKKENNIGFLREDGNSAANYLQHLNRQMADLKNESDRLQRDAAAGDQTENATKQASVRVQIENLERNIKLWEGKALDLARRIADWDKVRSKQEHTRGLYLQKIVAIRCAGVNRIPGQEPGGATLVSSRFSNPVFGPVIEHPFPGKGEAWGWNLASGKIVNSTEARPLSFVSAGEEKLRAAQVDLYEGPKTDGLTLKTLDAGFVPLGEDGWNTAPFVAMMQLEEAGKLLMVRPEVSASGGEVYAFVTREGATGVLQIAQGSPRKLRYKLIENGAGPQTPPKEPSAK